MQPVLSVAEMREVDAAPKAAGTPVSVLVERAGRAVFGEARRILDGCYGRRVIVVAGPGNNGNDGRVAARLLSRRGAAVRILEVKEAPARLPAADLVLDAAFGTGFHGDYDAPDPGGVPVLAVDVPTGLDADTGAAAGQAVRALATVTFGALKPGLLLGEGPERSGSLAVRPIGLPVPEPESSAQALVGDEDVAAWLPRPSGETHKWKTALAVVAGSPGMYGAARFVAHSAARAGAGMVRLGIPGASSSDLPAGEAVSRSLPPGRFDEAALEGIERCRALVVGPGLGRGEDVAASLRRLLAAAPVPAVVDADGLSALGEAASASRVISERQAPTVLTPHDGEFARLAGAAPGGDRLASVRRLASQTGATVLLKGSTTVVASPGGRALISAAGSARLATAGTGDVLSGVVGAFLARGLGGLEAAALAAHVHGRAAGLGFASGLVAADLPELVARFLSSAAEAANSRAG
jgi:NAD(P)H-hydrate epimerase